MEKFWRLFGYYRHEKCNCWRSVLTEEFQPIHACICPKYIDIDRKENTDKYKWEKDFKEEKKDK